MLDAKPVAKVARPKSDRRIVLWTVGMTLALAAFGLAGTFYFDRIPKPWWGIVVVLSLAATVACMVGIWRAALRKPESPK